MSAIGAVEGKRLRTEDSPLEDDSQPAALLVKTHAIAIANLPPPTLLEIPSNRSDIVRSLNSFPRLELLKAYAHAEYAQYRASPVSYCPLREDLPDEIFWNLMHHYIRTIDLDNLSLSPLIHLFFVKRATPLGKGFKALSENELSFCRFLLLCHTPLPYYPFDFLKQITYCPGFEQLWPLIVNALTRDRCRGQAFYEFLYRVRQAHPAAPPLPEGVGAEAGKGYAKLWFNLQQEHSLNAIRRNGSYNLPPLANWNLLAEENLTQRLFNNRIHFLFQVPPNDLAEGLGAINLLLQKRDIPIALKFNESSMQEQIMRLVSHLKEFRTRIDRDDGKGSFARWLVENDYRLAFLELMTTVRLVIEVRAISPVCIPAVLNALKEVSAIYDCKNQFLDLLADLQLPYISQHH